MKTALTYFRLYCLILLIAASVTGCHRDDQSDAARSTPAPSLTIKGKSISASELGPDYLQTIDISSDSLAKVALRDAKSLILDGTTVTVAEVRSDRTVNLKLDKLAMINGARIITNGNNLVIATNSLDFNNNDGITSFSPDTAQAKVDMPGADGGRVTLYVAKAVVGSLKVSLSGQKGGNGLPGQTGVPGARGARGADGVDGLMDCSHGGTNGGVGAVGGTGTDGAPGKPGGNGGDLYLLGEAARNRQNYLSFSSAPGDGGSGGAGGIGGDGGAGGEGGSGSAHCGGGHGGDLGPKGGSGNKGGDGLSGKSSGKVHP